MDTKPICPGCRKTLPPDVPLGLCPECLIKAGFNTGTGSGGEGAGFTPAPIEQIAKLFPQFEIIEFIGKGGMGAVYKARQPALDRFVALKILSPRVAGTPGFAERFNREARALARLVHTNIVAVHEFGQTGDIPYLIMEFVDGANLREVERAGRLTPEQALAIVPQICEALQFAHGEGIVHRDIKPENILIDKKGRVKITDFGIAKILGQTAEKNLTGAKDVVGTPHYMAPEQIEKPSTVDHRADIYSLGVVFYEMLTGELPLGKFAPPSKKVQVDVRLDDVVLHALEKEPERRYQQASQVKTAVETIAGGPGPIAMPPAAPAAGNPSASNGQITAAAVALMIAAGWKIMSAFTGLFVLAGGSGFLGKFLGFGSFFGALGSLAIFSIMLFHIVPGLLILFGGYQMLQRRSYAWSMAAGIISIVSCSLIGLPIGIWALVVLSRHDVKLAFGGNPPPAPVAPQPDRFWRRFAVVAGCVVLIPVVIAIFGIMAAIAFTGFKHSHATAGQLSEQQLKQAGIREDADDFRKDFSQSFPLNAGGRFSLDNVNGRVEIHGWSSNFVDIKAVIHGKDSQRVEEVKIKTDARPDELIVHTKQRPNKDGISWSWSSFFNLHSDNASVDYTIQTPQGARLDDIQTVNGSIVIAGISNDITASTVNGKMEIKDAARNLKLSTVNGKIAADMTVLGGGQSVSLDTVNGAIELTVPENADANFSANTVNGGLSSEFDALKVQKEFPISHNLTGSLGHGSATVKASTVNGSIKISKSHAAKQP